MLSRRTKHKPRESEMQEANEIKLGAMCANAHVLGTRGRHETGAGRAIARNPYRNKGKQPATAHETTPYIHRGLSKGRRPVTFSEALALKWDQAKAQRPKAKGQKYFS